VLVHLVGLAMLWFFLAGADPTYFSLLLILYPQTFRYLRLSYAIPAAIALTVAVVWREVLLSGRPLSENGTAVASGVLSVLFGVLFATWISPSGSAPTWS
jgi:hypothetical protein